MSGEELFLEIGNIDECFIVNAAPKEKSRILSKHVLPVAVCFILVACVFFASFMYVIVKIPDVYDDAIWGEDIYMESYGGEDENTEAYSRWEIAFTEQYDGYRMSRFLFEYIVNADDDDIFAVVVTDKDGNPYGTREYADVFESTGIFTETINGQLLIFVSKEDLFNMDLNENEKDLFVFVCANSAYFQKFR